MTDASGKNVDQLVAELGSKDAVVRQNARTALVNIGVAAVPSLVSALDAPLQHTRWEAAKSLAGIADPSAAEGLVAALGDTDSDVRWVAGEALVALGRNALKPVLTTLTKSELPEGTYQSSHHVLHELARQPDRASLLAPVLRALEQPEPEMAVPLAAQKALQNVGV